jgi:cell division transport system permease protein
MHQDTVLLWRRGIARGFVTARRERRWLAAFGALLGVLLVLQLEIFDLIKMQTIFSSLREQTDLRLEIKTTATDGEIQEFYAELQHLPIVANTSYITKEQALESARQDNPDLVAFLDQFGLENPFADTIGVTLSALEDYDRLVTFLEETRWHNVVDPAFLSNATNQERQVQELLSVARAESMFSTVLLALSLAALIFIITELVRRRARDRSDEILIEELVGTHPLSIFLPFATEATLLLWISIVVSASVLIILLMLLPAFLPAFSSTGFLSAFGENLSENTKGSLPLFFLLELLLAPLVAAAGAWWGIAPHIQSHTVSLHSA